MRRKELTTWRRMRHETVTHRRSERERVRASERESTLPNEKKASHLPHTPHPHERERVRAPRALTRRFHATVLSGERRAHTREQYHVCVPHVYAPVRAPAHPPRRTGTGAREAVGVEGGPRLSTLKITRKELPSKINPGCYH